MIVVLGSINLDLVAGMERAPEAGETLFAHSFNSYPGGKGANQAVAAARLGADVRFWGMVGEDDAADTMRAALADSGVDTRAIETAEGSATGRALIVVEESGQNRIVVIRGANFAIDTGYLTRHRGELGAGDLLLCQNEVPQAVILEAFEMARAAGATTLLNPAPAVELLPGLLALTDILIPNQSEAEALTGIPCHDAESAGKAAAHLQAMGPQSVIITLGSMGALVCEEANAPVLLPAHRVPVVDTTAAGDSFVGGLCAGLVAGLHLTAAADIGQAAAAYSVGRAGAQPSMGDRRALTQFATELGIAFSL